MRVIVLTGAGDKAFCAGADLQPGKGFAFDLAKPNLDYADLLRVAYRATLPSIARINGACMAGGIGLLCMVDLAVAADHVLFGLPEVKGGVFPMQVSSLLQHLAPRRWVREWCITGELDAKVEWLVQRIVDKSPTAIRCGKYAMSAVASMSFDEAAAHMEGQIALLSLTGDAREGLAAFNEKRKPSWTGK